MLARSFLSKVLNFSKSSRLVLMVTLIFSSLSFAKITAGTRAQCVASSSCPFKGRSFSERTNFKSVTAKEPKRVVKASNAKPKNPLEKFRRCKTFPF
ncbi:hypothetical protein KBB68_01045 [Candidatus Babeliales bacterium]|nr:hypothetical protein [Candidatus Babeliales bacterium]